MLRKKVTVEIVGRSARCGSNDRPYGRKAGVGSSLVIVSQAGSWGSGRGLPSSTQAVSSQRKP